MRAKVYLRKGAEQLLSWRTLYLPPVIPRAIAGLYGDQRDDILASLGSTSLPSVVCISCARRPTHRDHPALEPLGLGIEAHKSIRFHRRFALHTTPFTKVIPYGIDRDPPGDGRSAVCPVFCVKPIETAA